MSQNRVYIIPLLVLLGGGALVMFLANGKAPPKASEPSKPAVEKVSVQAITVGEQTLTVYAQGTVQATQEINLVSEVAGKVDSVSTQFVSGGFFDAGHTLLTIDADDYEIAKIGADARVAEAAELLATTRGQALQAKREWRDLGSKTANDLFLRKPQVARAEAQLAAAKAEARQARLNLARTAISVPFNGRVRSTDVNRGQYVSPGQAIARVYSTESAEVRLPLTDRQVGLLNLPLYKNAQQTDVPVTLRGTFGGKEWSWPASIQRTEAVIDAQSRVVYAVAVVQQPYAQANDSERPPLTIGQFVKADIKGRNLSGVAVIARDTLRAGNVVWIAQTADEQSGVGKEQDRLKIVPVKVVQLTPKQAIVSGLPEGRHLLVTNSIAFAVDNMPLSVPVGEPELILAE